MTEKEVLAEEVLAEVLRIREAVRRLDHTMENGFRVIRERLTSIEGKATSSTLRPWLPDQWKRRHDP